MFSPVVRTRRRPKILHLADLLTCNACDRQGLDGIEQFEIQVTSGDTLSLLTPDDDWTNFTSKGGGGVYNNYNSSSKYYRGRNVAVNPQNTYGSIDYTSVTRGTSRTSFSYANGSDMDFTMTQVNGARENNFAVGRNQSDKSILERRRQLGLTTDAANNSHELNPSAGFSPIRSNPDQNRLRQTNDQSLGKNDDKTEDGFEVILKRDSKMKHDSSDIFEKKGSSESKSSASRGGSFSSAYPRSLSTNSAQRVNSKDMRKNIIYERKQKAMKANKTRCNDDLCRESACNERGTEQALSGSKKESQCFQYEDTRDETNEFEGRNVMSSNTNKIDNFRIIQPDRSSDKSNCIDEREDGYTHIVANIDETTDPRQFCEALTKAIFDKQASRKNNNIQGTGKYIIKCNNSWEHLSRKGCSYPENECVDKSSKSLRESEKKLSTGSSKTKRDSAKAETKSTRFSRTFSPIRMLSRKTQYK